MGAALAAPRAGVYISVLLSSPEDTPPTPAPGHTAVSEASPSSRPPGSDPPPHDGDGDGGFMRFVFYFFWVFAVPFALASRLQAPEVGKLRSSKSAKGTETGR